MNPYSAASSPWITAAFITISARSKVAAAPDITLLTAGILAAAPGPEGTSDAGRVRDITVAVTPSHEAAILAAQEDGATESDLHDAVTEALADAYVRQGGGGAARLSDQIADTACSRSCRVRGAHTPRSPALSRPR